MPPSARITDFHACPIPTHVGGPQVVGDGTIVVGNVPAARVGDALACSCGLDLVSQGEQTVVFGGMPAARLGDATSHGGALAQGCPTVLIGSTAQTEALGTDKPFCEKCAGKKLGPLVPGHPPVIIDAHMHIQSGNCAPIAPIRARVFDLPLSRGFGNALVSLRLPFFGHIIAGNLGDMAPEPTHEIGNRLVSENNGIDFLVQGAGAYFLGISVVLTMDMDYMHIDGYDGLHIYQEEGERRFYYRRRDGTTPRDQLDKVFPDQDQEDMPLDAEESPETTPAMREESRQFDRYSRDLRSNCYETWRQQRRRTELAAASNPLRLLPLYHFEPRRYIKDEDRAFPFTQLVEAGGLYVGMKMYTSQGYMPDDSTPEKGEKTREITRWFFGRCQDDEVPIQTHCTPVGWYTHQRHYYIDLAAPEVRALYTSPRDQSLDDRGRLQYFQDHFLHPDAWRPVLGRSPNLRLCLAHWASNELVWRDPVADFHKPCVTRQQLRDFEAWAHEERGSRWWRRLHQLWPASSLSGYALPCVDTDHSVYPKSWIRGIIELARDFKNFYTDLSYLPLFKEYESWEGEKVPYWRQLVLILKEFPFMLDKIMFGTDWYMILADKLGYRAWFEGTRDALEKVAQELGGDYSAHYLFHRFAIINPIRFYRLGKIADKLKTNYTAAIGRLGDMGACEKARLLGDLERRHLVLAAACEEARLKKMDADVRRGPLRFTGPEGWQ